MYVYEDYVKAADYIRSVCQEAPCPRIALVLGSGLGGLTAELTDAIEIPYTEIPGFAASTVDSHAGKLVCGMLNGVPIYAMSGRFHFYEGYSFEQTAFPIRVLHLLGVQKLIVTNAAGGIDESFLPGDFMVLTDHIKFTAESPVRGKHIPEFGERFFDMSTVYDTVMQKVAFEAAAAQDIPLKQGVYAFMSGPQFETPAEIRMLRLLGASAVGMSTVAEVITAAQCKMQVLGISCITNLAAGITGAPVTDEEVCDTASNVSAKFKSLITTIVSKL